MKWVLCLLGFCIFPPLVLPFPEESAGLVESLWSSECSCFTSREINSTEDMSFIKTESETRETYVLEVCLRDPMVVAGVSSWMHTDYVKEVQVMKIMFVREEVIDDPLIQHIKASWRNWKCIYIDFRLESTIRWATRVSLVLETYLQSRTSFSKLQLLFAGLSEEVDSIVILASF